MAEARARRELSLRMINDLHLARHLNRQTAITMAGEYFGGHALKTRPHLIRWSAERQCLSIMLAASCRHRGVLSADADRIIAAAPMLIWRLIVIIHPSSSGVGRWTNACLYWPTCHGYDIMPIDCWEGCAVAQA